MKLFYRCIAIASFIFGVCDLSVAQSSDWAWARKASSPGNTETSTGVARDASGNTYITGYFEGTLTLGSSTLTSSGNRDIFLAKYDALGNLLWAQKAGGTGLDQGLDVTTDPSGNCIVTGQFKGSATFNSQAPGNSITLGGTGVADMFVASYTPAGALQWAKRFGGGTGNQVVGQSVATDGAGSCYLTGYFSGLGTVLFGTNSFTATGGSNSDVFVLKLTSTGNVVWASKAGGTGKDLGRAIVADAAGNSYITGVYRGTATFGTTSLSSASTSTDDLFIAKFNTTGGVAWANTASSGTNFKKVNDITIDGAGNLYLAGAFRGSVLFGSTIFTTTSGQSQFVAKFSSAGGFIWARQSGGASNVFTESNGIVSDPLGNTFVTGSFNGTASFNSTNSVTSNGLTDIFIARYNTAGSLQWVAGTGAAGTDSGNGIATDNNGNSFVTGHFQGFVSFGTTTLGSEGASVDVFTGKFGTPTANPVTISTGVISPLSYLAGATVSVPFTVTGTFLSGNVFTAQLSGPTGSFASPTSIGTLTGTSSGTITATIPATAVTGSGYRIRVISSSPAAAGTNNGADITISGPPSVTIVASQNPLPLGAVLTLSIGSPEPNTTYLWSGPYLSGTSGTQVTATPTALGTYTYTVTATNATGTTTSSLVVDVICVPPPVPTAAAGFICNGSGSVTLTATSAGATSFQWFETNTATVPLATGSTYTTPTLTTSKTYYVLAVAGPGCTSTSRRAVAATVVPTFTISASASDTVILSGEPVNLSATGSITGVTYSWIGANLTPTTGAVVAAAPTQNGTNTYTLTGRRGTCFAQNMPLVNIQVTACPNGTPTIPTIASVFLCNGGGTSVTLTPTGGGSSMSTYNWYETSNGTTPFFTGLSYTTPALTTNKTYYVTAVSSEGCESPRRAVSVTVVPTFTASATASATNILAGDPVALSASASISGVSYSWIGANLSPATGAVVSAAPTQQGTNTYTLVARRGTCNSQNTVNVQIEVTGCPNGTPTMPVIASEFLCNGGGTSVTLTPTGGGSSMSTYNWYETSNGTTPFHTGLSYTTPALTTNKTYYVTAVSSEGCESPRRAVSVTVVPTFTASATASATNILAGDPVALSASASISGVSYSWIGANLSPATGAVVSAAPTQQGTNTYTLVARRGTCNSQNTVNVQIEVTGCPNGTPTMPVIASEFLCNGGGTSVTLTPTGGGSSMSTYNWYETSNGTTPFHTGLSYTTPALTTNKTYYVTAVSSEGCESPRRAVSVTVVPTFTASATASATTILAGDPVNLSASASITGISYSWVGANLSPATGAVVAAAPSQPGVNTYTLIARRGTCYAQNSPQVSINVTSCANGTPTQPTISPVFLCNGGGTTATLNPTGGGSSMSTYNWYETSNGTTPFYTGLSYTTPALTTNKTYYVTAVSSEGCESPRRAVTVTVVPTFSVSATASSNTILAGQPVNLSATGTITGITYSWIGANLTPATGAVVAAAPAQSGSNTYTLTAKRGTCVAQNTPTVSVTVTSCSNGTPTQPTVAPIFLCNGGGTTATLSPTGGGSSVSTYNWYETSSSATAFYSGLSYTTPVLNASKTYYVTAVSAQGCESPRRAVAVTVVPAFTVSATATATTILAGNPVHLSSSASITGVTFSWAGPNLTPASGAVVAAAPNQAGTNTYTLLASRGSCAASNTVQLQIQVNACPGGTPTTPDAASVFLCNGGGTTATLTASGGGPSASTYRWYAASNAITPFFTGSTYTTPVLTAPSTRYYVSAVSAQGCESPRRTVTVTVVPAFTITADASASSILTGNPVQLSAASSLQSLTYSWVGPNLSATSGAVVAAMPSQAGFQNYTVYGKRGTCQAVNTVVLSVEVFGCPGGVPTTPLASSSSICNGGGTTTITASGGGNNVAMYKWYAAANSATPVYTGNTYTTPLLTAPSTRFYVTAVSNQGCESPRRIVTITVVPSFTVSATATPSTVALGGQSVLSATATTTNVSFVWSGPNLSTTSGQTVTATPASSGTFTYSVVGIRSGCTSAPAVTTVTVPTARPANPIDEIALEEEAPDLKLAAGVEQEKVPEVLVKINPNPFRDFFSVQIEQALTEETIVSLKDLSGREIWIRKFSAAETEGTLTINNLGTLPQGMYLLQVIQGSRVVTERLVKQ